MIRPPRAALAAVAAVATASLGACGDRETRSEGELRVATTVAPITSIVANVGGDRVAITGIVPEGTNSHTFEPKPSVAELLSEADVLYANGLELEDPTTELALQSGADVVELGTKALPESRYLYDFSFPREEGKPNPHLWTNPRYALAYSRVVRDDLSRRDPESGPYFAANYARFASRIAQLDKAMRTAFATVPAGQRRLLTYHDAYAYFGQDYGWKVVGAIQPSSFAEPTPKDVAALVEQVRAQRVQAIFGSEVFPSPVLAQIGNETGAEYVDVLRDDDLPGEPGAPEHSWLGLMTFDYITMTEAMGGDASALRKVSARSVTPDTAEYPQ